MKLYSALYFLSSGLLERVNCAFLFCLLGFIFRFSTRQAWLQSHALGCLSLLSVTTPEGCFAAQQCHPSQLSASRQQHRFHMGTHREAPEAQDNRSASSSEGLNFLVTSPPPFSRGKVLKVQLIYFIPVHFCKKRHCLTGWLSLPKLKHLMLESKSLFSMLC